jgi:hypothetical protein
MDFDAPFAGAWAPDGGTKPDASPSGGSAGDGAKGGSGGVGEGGNTGEGGNVGQGGNAGAGGTSGQGGNAGAGGTSGQGGSAGAGGIGGSGGAQDAGLVCDPLQLPDGGALLRWRDWANDGCLPCPAANLACKDFDMGTARLDPVSKEFLIELLPGKAEVKSAVLSFAYQAVVGDGGAMDGAVSNVAMSVDHNTLRVNLSGKVPNGIFIIGEIDLVFEDACGTQFDVNDYGICFIAQGSTDPIVIHCEA